jgi:hypothetical protein
METHLPNEYTAIVNANRPMKYLYIAIAKTIEDDKYLTMTDNEFIDQVMKYANNSNKNIIRSIYEELMNDASMSPIFEGNENEN